MTTKENTLEPNGLTISYKELGNISIDELAHAVWEDIQVLKDLCNVRYVKAPRLKLFFNNEYGEAVRLRRPGRGRIHYMDTHHFRPACKDYGL